MVVGDAVQTPFGKGVVREVRNRDRCLVEVGGRQLELRVAQLQPLPSGVVPRGARATHANQPRTTGGRSAGAPAAAEGPTEVDLHGLTVEEALSRVNDALNRALLSDAGHLRLIHGRSGGRIRAALHRRLEGIASVRGFHLDPHNPGVTIVVL